MANPNRAARFGLISIPWFTRKDTPARKAAKRTLEFPERPHFFGESFETIQGTKQTKKIQTNNFTSKKFVRKNFFELNHKHKAVSHINHFSSRWCVEQLKHSWKRKKTYAIENGKILYSN